VSGARIREVPLDQGIKAEAFVQLAREQQPSIGSDRRSPELDAKLGIAREAKIMPSAPARHPRSAHFLRLLRDYGMGSFSSQNENAG
jgi:hypothetical protein